mmetsp:Transcript_2764/g.4998  ORF Transcript_2764/g.4998 Transcript_2764/m.4998 type:complete len:309 (+) Transcript_2764:167-1093(+)
MKSQAATRGEPAKTKHAVAAVKLGAIAVLVFLAEPISAITKLGRTGRRQQHLALKYIFAGDEDYSDKQKSQTGFQRCILERSPTSSSKLHEIARAFKEALPTPQKEEKNVHVGRLLTAMKKMETHMRQVGMTQQANDLKGNHDKVMRLYSTAPAEKRNNVADLLKWELDTGIHGQPGDGHSTIRVKNNSGAMGLFWLGHTVKYQYDLYRLMLEEGYAPVEAAKIAFKRDLEPHLDWASSRLVQATIPRVTPASQEEFFSILGGYSNGGSYGPNVHKRIKQDVKAILGVWDELLDGWTSTFDELHLRDI